ncbi:MAG: hypothetical protein K6T75_08455 [Acetobacteraceae bacterium]|nr:hypothetical protein [Acetobacteraceae bacterium]
MHRRRGWRFGGRRFPPIAGASGEGGPGHEERLRILKMVESGKLSAADAVKLLEALEGPAGPGPWRWPGGGRGPRARAAMGAAIGASADGPRRWVRVRVQDLKTGRPRLNLHLPMGLVNVALGIAGRFAHWGLDEELSLEALLESIRSGAQGKLIDLEDEEEGVRLEILVE